MKLIICHLQSIAKNQNQTNKTIQDLGLQDTENYCEMRHLNGTGIVILGLYSHWKG
jgi:hypothetical protein